MVVVTRLASADAAALNAAGATFPPATALVVLLPAAQWGAARGILGAVAAEPAPAAGGGVALGIGCESVELAVEALNARVGVEEWLCPAVVCWYIRIPPAACVWVPYVISAVDP